MPNQDVGTTVVMACVKPYGAFRHGLKRYPSRSGNRIFLTARCRNWLATARLVPTELPVRGQLEDRHYGTVASCPTSVRSNW